MAGRGTGRFSGGLILLPGQSGFTSQDRMKASPHFKLLLFCFSKVSVLDTIQLRTCKEKQSIIYIAGAICTVHSLFEVPLTRSSIRIENKNSTSPCLIYASTRVTFHFGKKRNQSCLSRWGNYLLILISNIDTPVPCNLIFLPCVLINSQLSVPHHLTSRLMQSDGRSFLPEQSQMSAEANVHADRSCCFFEKNINMTLIETASGHE